MSSTLKIFITSILLVGLTPQRAFSQIDLDDNGIDDKWEEHYNLGSIFDDPDGDGVSSKDEYAFGTNPNNGASFLNLELSLDGDQHTHLSWNSEEHIRYQLQYS